jgi:hydroxymethylpyrimidine/phosphomethylpyrimidine kinase
MGHLLPDRLFWAETDDEGEGDDDSDGLPATAEDFSLHRHETKH